MAMSMNEIIANTESRMRDEFVADLRARAAGCRDRADGPFSNQQMLLKAQADVLELVAQIWVDKGRF